MKAVHYTKVQENSKKQKRVWLEGLKLSDAGFTKGKKYVSVFNISDSTLTLTLDKSGDKVVSGKKKRGTEDEYTPIIDICNANVAKTFGKTVKLKATISKGCVEIVIHHEEKAEIEREARTLANIKKGTLTEASLCTGIGISTHAIHTGLKDAGIESTLERVCEIEPKYLEVAQQNNESITKDTKFFVGALEELETDLLSKVDILSASLPCTGHSKAGKSKNKIICAEDHKDASTSVFGFMNIVRACSPSIIISENVTEARDSATYSLIRSELSRLGYNIHERIMGKKEGACVENRNRYWFVAISNGLDNFDLEKLLKTKEKYKSVGDVLEGIPQSDSRFFPDTAFTKRAEENAKAGRNFACQFVTAKDTSIGVIPRHYNKRQVSNPHLKGKGKTVRLFTPREHARLKGIPEHLVEGISPTTAHEGLGQSILYNHAYSIARSLGKCLAKL